MNTYFIYSERIFNNSIDTFENIITIDSLPEGPLRNLVCSETVMIKSHYQLSLSIPISNTQSNHSGENEWEDNEKTVFAIMHPSYKISVLLEEDLYLLFQFLNDNQYIIETNIRIINEQRKMQEQENKRLICMVYTQ